VVRAAPVASAPRPRIRRTGAGRWPGIAARL